MRCAARSAPPARLTDDLTLALALLPGDTLQASRRELARGLDDLGHVRGLVEDRARKAGLDQVGADLFALACVEAYTNAVRHTRGRPAQAPIELVVSLDDGALSVEIVTLGSPSSRRSMPQRRDSTSSPRTASASPSCARPPTASNTATPWA